MARLRSVGLLARFLLADRLIRRSEQTAGTVMLPYQQRYIYIKMCFNMLLIQMSSYVNAANPNNNDTEHLLKPTLGRKGTPSLIVLFF